MVKMIYDLLMETRKEMRDSFEALEKKMDNCDQRPREVEEAKSKLYGMAAVVGAVATAVVQLIIHQLRGGQEAPSSKNFHAAEYRCKSVDTGQYARALQRGAS